MRGLISALRTLSRIPCPGRDSDSLADALPFFPWIGALLGCLTLAVFLLGRLILPEGLIPSALAVLFLAWLTRGLHLDGLADAADALGGGYTIERRLAIMKDPHVGAFGVITLIGAILLKVAAFFAFYQVGFFYIEIAAAPWRQLLGITLPFIVSRTVQVWLCTSLPYARTTGGTAGPFVGGARWTHLGGALAGALFLCALIHPVAGPLLLAFGLILGLGLRRFFRIRFGGITGDLLGASNEIVEVTGLILYTVLLSHMGR
jgi:adenosylcobinamide-GDP ribazoletransferase